MTFLKICHSNTPTIIATHQSAGINTCLNSYTSSANVHCFNHKTIVVQKISKHQSIIRETHSINRNIEHTQHTTSITRKTHPPYHNPRTILDTPHPITKFPPNISQPQRHVYIYRLFIQAVHSRVHITKAAATFRICSLDYHWTGRTHSPRRSTPGIGDAGGLRGGGGRVDIKLVHGGGGEGGYSDSDCKNSFRVCFYFFFLSLLFRRMMQITEAKQWRAFN